LFLRTNLATERD